eukprot:Clim_evm93s149 gene=Clim_evmTU93s149
MESQVDPAVAEALQQLVGDRTIIYSATVRVREEGTHSNSRKRERMLGKAFGKKGHPEVKQMTLLLTLLRVYLINSNTGKPDIQFQLLDLKKVFSPDYSEPRITDVGNEESGKSRKNKDKGKPASQPSNYPLVVLHIGEDDAHRTLMMDMTSPTECDTFLLHLRGCFRRAFATYPWDPCLCSFDIRPVARKNALSDALTAHFGFDSEGQNEDDLNKNDSEENLNSIADWFSVENNCGGCALAYAAVCDHMGLAVNPEVAWDLNNIYGGTARPAHRRRAFDMTDFVGNDTDTSSTAVPLIRAIALCNHFTSVDLTGLKVNTEMQKALVAFFASNQSIGKVILDEITTPKDFFAEVGDAWLSNKDSFLTELSMANCSIDERSFAIICKAIANSPVPLRSLNVSKCKLGPKSTALVLQVLNKQHNQTLRYLNLSGNALDKCMDELMELVKVSSLLTSITLQDCSIFIPTLFESLILTDLRMNHLDLSKNTFHKKDKSNRRSDKSAADPTWAFTEFFTRVTKLRSVNFGSTGMPLPWVLEMLKGLKNNNKVKSVKINIENNNLGPEAGGQLGYMVGFSHNIEGLALGQNALDEPGLTKFLQPLRNVNFLRSLSIDENMGKVRSKNRVDTIFNLMKFITSEYCRLEYLSLRHAHLKGDLVVVIDALGVNHSIKVFDMTDNQCGDSGARSLSKALQVNNTLELLHMDENDISMSGYRDLKIAFNRNKSIRELPIPFKDIEKIKNGRTDSSAVYQLFHEIQAEVADNAAKSFGPESTFSGAIKAGDMSGELDIRGNSYVLRLKEMASELREHLMTLELEPHIKMYVTEADRQAVLSVVKDSEQFHQITESLQSMWPRIMASVARALQERQDDNAATTLDACANIIEGSLEKLQDTLSPHFNIFAQDQEFLRSLPDLATTYCDALDETTLLGLAVSSGLGNRILKSIRDTVSTAVLVVQRAMFKRLESEFSRVYRLLESRADTAAKAETQGTMLQMFASTTAARAKVQETRKTITRRTRKDSVYEHMVDTVGSMRMTYPGASGQDNATLAAPVTGSTVAAATAPASPMERDRRYQTKLPAVTQSNESLMSDDLKDAALAVKDDLEKQVAAEREAQSAHVQNTTYDEADEPVFATAAALTSASLPAPPDTSQKPTLKGSISLPEPPEPLYDIPMKPARQSNHGTVGMTASRMSLPEEDPSEEEQAAAVDSLNDTRASVNSDDNTTPLRPSRRPRAATAGSNQPTRHMLGQSMDEDDIQNAMSQADGSGAPRHPARPSRSQTVTSMTAQEVEAATGARKPSWAGPAVPTSPPPAIPENPDSPRRRGHDRTLSMPTWNQRDLSPGKRLPEPPNQAPPPPPKTRNSIESTSPASGGSATRRQQSTSDSSADLAAAAKAAQASYVPPGAGAHPARPRRRPDHSRENSVDTKQISSDPPSGNATSSPNYESEEFYDAEASSPPPVVPKPTKKLPPGAVAIPGMF